MKTSSNALMAFFPFVCLLLAASTQAETVVFFDTFDAPDGINMNENLEARQAGGKIVSPYEKYGGQADQSAIASNELRRTGPGGLNVTENFAGQICGKNFSISADIRCLSPEGWGAMSLLSDNASDRGLCPLSIRLHGEGLVVVSSGRAGEMPSHVETVFPSDKIGKVLGEGFQVTDTHNYKIVVTEEGNADHMAFFIDGVEFPLKSDTVEFVDETKRKINFINVNDIGTDIVYDNLKLTIDVAPSGE